MSAPVEQSTQDRSGEAAVRDDSTPTEGYVLVDKNPAVAEDAGGTCDTPDQQAAEPPTEDHRPGRIFKYYRRTPQSKDGEWLMAGWTEEWRKEQPGGSAVASIEEKKGETATAVDDAAAAGVPQERMPTAPADPVAGERATDSHAKHPSEVPPTSMPVWRASSYTGPHGGVWRLAGWTEEWELVSFPKQEL